MNDTYQGISIDKIARIWELKNGTFVVADWNNNRVSPSVFCSDAEAGQYAKDTGFESICWEEEAND